MRTLLSLSIFLIASTVYCQSTLITMEGYYLDNIFGQSIGDSVILFYTEGSGNTLQGSIISSSGSTTHLQIPELYKKLFCGALDSEENIDFYFFEKKDKNSLRILRYNKLNKTNTILTKGIQLEGKFIGSVSSNNELFLFNVLPNEVIKIIQIQNGEINKEATFKLDIPFSKYIEISAPSLIPEGTLITARQAEAQIKIYLKNNQFLISLEFEKKVELIKLDMNTAAVKSYIVRDEWGEDYGTFINQDTLFSVAQIDKDYFKINIYEIESGRKINSFEINKDSPFKNEKSFLRDERTKVVLNNKSVWDAMSNVGRPFICAYTMEDGSTMLKTGTHRSMISGGMVPLPGIIGAMVSGAINQATGTEKSLDLYFFMRGTSNTGFKYDNSLALIEQRIDTYETYDRKKKKKTKYRTKAYIHAPGKTLSIYKTTKESDIKVLSF